MLLRAWPTFSIFFTQIESAYSGLPPGGRAAGVKAALMDADYVADYVAKTLKRGRVSYRRILVTGRVRRQRFEFAI
jgi:hypothetical protein